MNYSATSLPKTEIAPIPAGLLQPVERTITPGPAANADRIRLTVMQSQIGLPVGKAISLNSDQSLKKDGLACNLNSGSQQQVSVADAAEFAQLLGRLEPHQALVYGLAEVAFSAIITKKQEAAGVSGTARTLENFAYAAGAPGILMLDYDPAPGTQPLGGQQLLDLVYQVVPGAREAGHVWAASAGSCIYRTDTGVEVEGITGQRVYLMVRDASDIPRAGGVLHNLLWEAGHGYFRLSVSGALLERGPFDTSVWQSNRLDFCGPAACDTGLEQRKPAPVVFGAGLLDTRTTLPDIDTERQSVIDRLKADAKEALKPQQTEVRETYITERAPAVAEEAGITIEEAQVVLRQALENGILLGDFVLHPAPGETVTVRQVLDDPEKWHNHGFLDPLEPEYQRNYRIARVNFYGGGRPYIWSFAHGGRRFTLHRQPQTIQVEAGDLPGTCDRVMDVLRVADPELFERGQGAESELIAVAKGHVIPQCQVQLQDRIGRVVRFERFDGRSESYKVVDCPGNVAVTLHRRRGRWGLKQLNGIATAPTLRPDGSLLTQPGYDPDTGLLLLNRGGTDFNIPQSPPVEQVQQALRWLWEPFGLFPLAGPTDRAVLLSALLTAACRPSLPTAPAFLIDASTAGSGKTLLSTCIGYLATGQILAAQAFPARDEDEVKKLLFAALRGSNGALLLDNVEGVLRSPAMAAMLTQPVYGDRVLGESRQVRVHTNSLILVNGNGVQVDGDLNRRLLRCTIEPNVERPDLRQFGFNPLELVKQRRIDMVRAALFLIRGYITAGRPKAGMGAMASFETWDSLIRQTVCWLGQVVPDFGLDDPLSSIEAGYTDDSETGRLRALLHAWYACYSNQDVRIKDLLKALGRPGEPVYAADQPEGLAELKDAVEDIASDGRGFNSRTLSWFLRRFKGRIVGGLRVRMVRSDEKHGSIWSVGPV